MEELKKALKEFAIYFDREYKGTPESYEEVINYYEDRTGRLKDLLSKITSTILSDNS